MNEQTYSTFFLSKQVGGNLSRLMESEMKTRMLPIIVNLIFPRILLGFSDVELLAMLAQLRVKAMGD